MSIIARMSSSLSCSILFTSCDVRKPSKKCRNGTRASSVDAWAIIAMSCASWTESPASMAQPVLRQDITSLWSPKIDKACVARVRAAMWNTVGVNSPAILNMLGIISSRPCDAVNVVVKAPAWIAPWTRAGRPALALHLDHVRHHAEDVLAAGRRPVVGQLAHVRTRA